MLDPYAVSPEACRVNCCEDGACTIYQWGPPTGACCGVGCYRGNSVQCNGPLLNESSSATSRKIRGPVFDTPPSPPAIPFGISAEGLPASLLTIAIGAALAALCLLYILRRRLKSAIKADTAVTPLPLEPKEQVAKSSKPTETSFNTEKRVKTLGEMLSDDLLFEAVVPGSSAGASAHTLSDDLQLEALSAPASRSRTPGQILADELLFEAMGDTGPTSQDHLPARNRVHRRLKGASSMSDDVRRKPLKTGELVDRPSAGRPPDVLDGLEALPDAPAHAEDAVETEVPDDGQGTRWAFVREEHLQDQEQVRTKTPIATIANDLLLEAMANS